MTKEERQIKAPAHMVEAGLRKASSIKWCGIPLTELSRDELLAAAALGWAAQLELLEHRYDQRRTTSPR